MREADCDALDRTGVVDVRGLEDSPTRERQHAEPVHDSAREPDLSCELVVEMDREVVSRGSGVADRLVVGDERTSPRPRGSPSDLEAVVGCSLAELPRPCTPRKNSVTYCSFTSSPSLVARLGLDHERRPVRARREARPESRARRAHAGDRGADGAAGPARSARRSGGRRRTRRPAMRVRSSSIGTIAKTGPPATSSVASAYACMAASVTSYACPSRGDRSRRGRKLRQGARHIVPGMRFRLPDNEAIVPNAAGHGLQAPLNSTPLRRRCLIDPEGSP